MSHISFGSKGATLEILGRMLCLLMPVLLKIDLILDLNLVPVAQYMKKVLAVPLYMSRLNIDCRNERVLSRFSRTGLVRSIISMTAIGREVIVKVIFTVSNMTVSDRMAAVIHESLVLYALAMMKALLTTMTTVGNSG